MSVLAGNLAALTQTSLKRMLAFSSVANAGYAALCLVLGVVSLPSILVFLIIYGVGVIVAFACVSFFAQALGREPNADIEISELSQVANNSSPWILAVFSLSIFSLAGIPPLPGFLGKYMLLKSLWEGHQVFASAILVLGSLLGLGYYLRIFVPMYMTAMTGGSAPVSAQRARVSNSGAWIATASFGLLLVLLLGFSRFALWVDYAGVFARLAVMMTRAMVADQNLPR